MSILDAILTFYTKKQTTNFSSANLKLMLSPSFIILRIHYEPPHQDLRCAKIHLFSSLVSKELKATGLIRTLFRTMTEIANFSMKYFMLSKVLTDEGGITYSYHGSSAFHSLKLVNYLLVQADKTRWYQYYLSHITSVNSLFNYQRADDIIFVCKF